MDDHERGFVTFLAEPTKRRVETLLDLGQKRRGDVRALLDHAVRLNPNFSQRLSGNEAFSASVNALLRVRGAPPSCYVLAADPRLDGREMPLAEALEVIVGKGNGAFVSCIPGRLGFYEFEDMKSSYLLSR